MDLEKYVEKPTTINLITSVIVFYESVKPFRNLNDRDLAVCCCVEILKFEGVSHTKTSIIVRVRVSK